jgi:three-Cys-motif partner protein
MARYNAVQRSHLFIDGFAGPGHEGGEEGSPLIAIGALFNHPQFETSGYAREVVFAFTEQDPQRFAALQAELGQLQMPDWVKVDAVQGEFAPVMMERLDGIEARGARLAPTFAFIDPFGFAGVPMNTVSRILANPRCECLITFMFESVNRFLSHENPRIQEHFDELFGTTEWRALLQLPNGPDRP